MVKRLRTGDWLARARRGLRAFLAERRGAAALEFAFVAPVLLSLYFVTMEVGQGIETNKKVSRIGSMVADLVTQQQGDVSAEDLESIMQIGAAILYPYNRTRPKIVITAIKISDEEVPEVRVAWSRKMVEGSFSQDLPPERIITDIPDKLNIRNTFLIRVSSELEYRPVITWSAEKKAAMGLAAAFDRIDMKETYYLRPRMSNEIDCRDC